MKAKIVGIEFVDYVKKKDNTRVCGFSVHIVKDPHSSKASNFKGQEATSVWISSADVVLFEKLRSMPINQDYDFVYEYDGRFTNIVDIRAISDPVNKTEKKEV